MRKLFLFLIIISIPLLSVYSALAQTGWVAVNMPQRNYKSINFVNNQTGFIISSDGYIERTTNGGNTWSEMFTGFSGSSNGAGYFTTAMLGTVCYANKIYTTTNGGLNWIYSIAPAIQGVSLGKSAYINNSTGFAYGVEYISSSAPNSAIISYVYKTTNSGNTWFQIFNESFIIASDYYVKNEDSITVFAGAIYKTTTGGTEWDTSGFHITPSFSPRSFTNPYKDTIHACGTYGMIRSTNEGETWSFTYSQISFAYFRKISFLNSKTGYSVGDSGKVFYTSNAGESWTKQKTNVTQPINDIAIINKDTVFAVGDNGVVIKTFNGGLTSSGEQVSFLPENYKLLQNYPNPFNPNTIINFQLHKNSFINLNIYDVNGRLIKILESGFKPAGEYFINFSAEGLASGVYYYSLYADGVLMNTKKAVVLK